MFKAIFLGSFDPPTIGHLHLISEALSVGAEVLVIPAFGNPWKTDQTPYNLRVQMLEEAVKGYSGDKVSVSRIEEELATGDSIPTVNVLRELKKRIGNFKVITTNETYLEIPGWKNGEDVLKENEFLIFSVSHLGPKIPGSFEITDLPVSSTLVRSCVRDGKEILEYVPMNVNRIIKENKLYV